MSWHSQTLDENFFSPPLFSSRRDVPAERLYTFVRVAEKGGSQPGSGISHHGRLRTLMKISPNS